MPALILLTRRTMGLDPAALEEFLPAQVRVFFPQFDQALRKCEQLLFAVVKLPVVPGDLVILTIGIVVAALRSPDFVAAANHWDAMRQQKRCHEIPLLALPKFDDPGIVSRTFDARDSRSCCRSRRPRCFRRLPRCASRCS